MYIVAVYKNHFFGATNIMFNEAQNLYHSKVEKFHTTSKHESTDNATNEMIPNLSLILKVLISLSIWSSRAILWIIMLSTR